MCRGITSTTRKEHFVLVRYATSRTVSAGDVRIGAVARSIVWDAWPAAVHSCPPLAACPGRLVANDAARHRPGGTAQDITSRKRAELALAESEALERLDDGEAVDVLVSDLSMPVMDGLTLIREAKRRRPDLPAILLTGFSTNVADIAKDDDVERPFLLLRKPISGTAIVERVASLLEERDVEDEAIPAG
jgi:CheY-like chemotaxis protein